jgi:hypothetical protein
MRPFPPLKKGDEGGFECLSIGEIFARKEKILFSLTIKVTPIAS